MSDIVKVLRAIDHMSVEDCFLQSPMFEKAAAEIERLRALLKEVDDWVRDLEPFADAGHEPVTVFKKVRAALTQEKPNDAS